MKKKFLKGFTLVEILVAVSILAIGLAPILQALAVSLNTFGVYAHFVNVAPWVDEKIWETQDDLARSGSLAVGETSGRAVIQQKEYDWTMAVDAVSFEDGLYRINLDLSWTKGLQTRHVSRTAYALVRPRDDQNKGTTVK